MTARSYTIELPFGALNLNDIIRALREAGFRRGVIDERVRTRHTKRRGKPRDDYRSIKGQWSTRVLAFARQQRVPDDPFPNGAHVHFHIVEMDKLRDPDNFTTGTTKVVLDGLVNARVLRTDGWKGVLSLGYSWEVGPKPLVRVTLTAPNDPPASAASDAQAG